MLTNPLFPRIRSYIRRGRRTNAQARAFASGWAQLGLSVDSGVLDYTRVFGRVAPCILEIGFGSGISLISVAQSQPHHDFIGIETHYPGIGAICMEIQKHKLTNLRLYQQDAVDVLTQGIADESLYGIQIFFPDPWPKRRHHARRLIQQDFASLIVRKLKPGGFLHLATDWQDYAMHMMAILNGEKNLMNLAGCNQFAARSQQRPVVTRFELRALQAGRAVYDLQFAKLER